MTNANYDIVLLDLDHTLFDFDASEQLAFADIAAWANIDDPASAFATYKQLNSALWKRVESGDLLATDVRLLRSTQLISALSLTVDPVELTDRFLSGLGQYGDLYPGASAVLDALASTTLLGMVTNGVSEVQRAKIKRLHLDQWFHAVSISGELNVAKPNTAIFDHALAQFDDVDRSRVLMIGDSLGSDIAGAIQSGIDACWYNPVAADTANSARYVIDDLDQIPGLI